MFNLQEAGDGPRGRRAIAIAFLLIGIAVTVVAERRACELHERPSPHVVVSARAMNLKPITWTMAGRRWR